ncbi:MAG: succinate dehydrogenase [Candidatus Kariarchaeaceae archaeon]|jgi:hypothetical protein
MSEAILLPVVEEKRFANDRGDTWWLRPTIQGAYLILFGFYAMWAVAIDFENYDYELGDVHFISPFFNPDIEVSWWPEGLSPGLILIWAPLGFRATCYYARKVYYRAFFWDPPGCAIDEARAHDGNYRGENKAPFIINNIHRYFFFLAFVLAIIHSAEFISLIFQGGLSTGVGAGATIILGLDALFLSLYVLSCHSCKHIIGGSMNRNSGGGLRKFRFKSWKIVKTLNERHHVYFWLSLTTILIADIYVRFGLAYGLLL